MSENPEERLAALEARMRVLEDQAALLRLIYSWGPAVDTGNAEAAAGLWTQDGVLDSDLSRLDGPPAVAAMVESDGQQQLITQGCAHVQTAPIVTVDGDRATATAYSQVFVHAEAGHDVWRVSANLWEFRRTPEGWRVTRRTNRVVDGGPQARQLLLGAFGGERPGS